MNSIEARQKFGFGVSVLAILGGILVSPVGAAWQGKYEVPLMRRSLPDLTVGALHGTCVRLPAPVLKAHVAIKNLSGTATIAQFVTTVEGRVFMPASHGPSPNQIDSQQIAVGDHTTAAGFTGEESFSFEIPIPPNTTSVQFRAHVDRNGQVNERDETNNSGDRQISCTLQ